MAINTAPDLETGTNKPEFNSSSFFWTDLKLFDNHRERNFNTLIAIHQVLLHYSTLQSEEEPSEIQEFLEIYDRIAAEQSEEFTLIWSDPSAAHWCQLAYDLVKATLTGKPLPLVTQQYCQAIQQKTPLQGLIAHLNQFKLFAIAHAFLYDHNYQFKTPFVPRLPLAIPSTSLYLEGAGKVKISGIRAGKIEILNDTHPNYLELTPHATLAEGNLKVGQCPTLPLKGWELRFQPYCFNSVAFADAETMVDTGMNYQEQYVALVKEGLALIEQYQPQTFRQLHYFMQILALKRIESGTFTNQSSSDFPGASIWSVINNPYRLADNLIHEFHHNRLFLIEQNNPLLLNSLEDTQANNLYYSPWRNDLRPLRGIFHALYVFTPVAQFWLNVYQSHPTGELLDFAQSQVITTSLKLQIGLEQLRKYAQFTPLGQELLDDLASKLSLITQEINHLQLSLDIPALNFHRNGTFQYQLEEKTARFLTAKEIVCQHVKSFDHFKQIEPQFQTDLGLDPSCDREREEKAPAIAYGEQITGELEAISTLAETLKQRVNHYSHGSLVDLTDNQGIAQTYGDLWQEATILLSYLQEQGFSAGDFVIIQVERCHDFVAAVWSCFLGGFIPVPVAISPNRFGGTLQNTKLCQIWEPLDNSIILTTETLRATIKATLKDYTPNILTLESSQGFAPSEHFHANQPQDIALLLTSSGTTGHPKLISLDAIAVISQFLSRNGRTDETYRFLTWIPWDNASGFSIVNPQLGQTLYLPSERFFGNPLLWLDIVDQYKVKGTVLTNFAMTRIIEQVKEIAQPHWDLSSIQTIGLGAEKIMAQTCRSFIKMLQPLGLRSDVLNLAYGLSETGVVASTHKWVAMGFHPRSEQFVQIGKPLPGCGIRIVDNENNLLNEGEIGRIQIWRSSITRGYYNNPPLNRTLFTEDGWFNTGDLGFLNDHCLTVTGREKEIIIINGRNYAYPEIESVIDEVEGVQPFYTVACSIRQPDSDTDELAIFFSTVVTEDRQLGNLARQIRGKLTQTLGINPKYLIPTEPSAIPRTTTGKIQRLQLKERLETGEFDALIQWIDALIQQALEHIYVAPRNPLERQLAQIWENVLGRHGIGIYDNFFDLGGHSILAVKLVAEIEKTFPQKLSLAALYQAPTVEKLSQILSQEKWSSSGYSLVPIQPLGDKIPLFAIHLLGEGLSFYRPLSKYLGLRQPIYGLNYGLAARNGDKKQVSLPSIEDLAAHYIEEMRTFYPQGPYILLGISNGGNVAFEMAKQLYAQGQNVAQLILFDTIHPNVKLPKNWKNRPRLQKHILNVMRNINIHWGNLWLFEPQERLPYLLDKVKRFATKLPQFYDALSPTISQSSKSVDGVINPQPAINSPSVTSRLYIPQSYLGKIILFKAKHTFVASLDPTNGWDGVAAEGLEVYDIHGAHSKILSEPSVRILSEKLRDCLRKVQSESTGRVNLTPVKTK